MERTLGLLYFGYLGIMIGIGVLGDLTRTSLLTHIVMILGLGFLAIMGIVITGGVVFAIGYGVWSLCRKVAQ
jgi:hypothetical protein